MTLTGTLDPPDPPCPRCAAKMDTDNHVWLVNGRFYCSERCARDAALTPWCDTHRVHHFCH